MAMKPLRLLFITTVSTLLGGQLVAGNDQCLKTYNDISSKSGIVIDPQASGKESNLFKDAVLVSDYSFLNNEVTDSHRPFYHVNQVLACLSSDGQMVTGLQFGIGGAPRDDIQELVRQRPETANVAVDALGELKLSFMGIRKGNCVQHNIDKGDYITDIVVKHSEKTINVVQFMTKNGLEKKIGSDQSDLTNAFRWQTTRFALEDHERLQGGFAQVQENRGEISLTTLGFFTFACKFEKPKPKPKPAVTIQDSPSGSTSTSGVNGLKRLNFDNLGSNSRTTFDSISGAPSVQDEQRRKTSIELVIVLIVLTMLTCCICTYFIAKYRGTCFRKLTEAERGNH